MPPKEKVSRARVRDVAFEMTRESGFDAVTARKLAERIGCSTQPIFRAYENMEELKKDLFFMSAEFFSDYMLKKRSRTQPAYITMGMAYIELAVRETNLFKLIASIEDYGAQTLQDYAASEEAKALLDKFPNAEHFSTLEKEELFVLVSTFTHGLATMIASGHLRIPDKDIKSLLGIAYDSFVSGIGQ